MQNSPSAEIPYKPQSAWIVYFLFAAFLATWITYMATTDHPSGAIGVPCIIISILGLILLPSGSYVVGPNQSRALVLFGNYKGTVRKQGFFVTNPFTMKNKVSLKASLFTKVMSKVAKLTQKQETPFTTVVNKVSYARAILSRKVKGVGRRLV